MVSHKHQCIFVHIPKAAGTSIERAFLDDLDLDMENRHALLLGENTNNSIGPRRVSHLTATEYVNLHFVSQQIFDKYFKFAIVRNPLDRLYSTYKYKKFSDYLSFDNFIKLKLESLFYSEIEGYFYKSQYDYIYKDEKKLVDYVGRLENLNNDFKVIQQKLQFGLHLRHDNQSKSKTLGLRKIRRYGKVLKDPASWFNFSFKDKSKTLSEESLLLVEKLYKNDFKTFGYILPDLNEQ